jgi:single-stranded-DNA-specific exonuclease
MEIIKRDEEGFFSAIEGIVKKIKPLEKIVVIHHYDADGLTSGAIAVKALEREGKKVTHLCLKQIYKENIEEIKALGENYLFVDFGSGQLDYLKSDLGEDNTFILDHHEPLKHNGKIIGHKNHVNPLLFGIDGGKELSGAGVTFFFALALNKKNSDLSTLAIIGALGDMQDFHGQLEGINRKIIEIAKNEGGLGVKQDLRLYGRISRPLVSYLMFSSNPILPGLTANRENCISFLTENNIPIQFADQWLSYEDLMPEDKQKLSSALITYLAMNEVPEWKIKSLIGEVYTLENEENKSPLRDGKEAATLGNSCGRHAKPEVALKVYLGDRDLEGAYGEALALMQEHRVALRKGIEFVEQNGVEEKSSYYFFDAGSEIQDSLVGIIAGMLYGSVIDENKPIIALGRYDKDTIKVSGRGTSTLIRRGLNLGLAFKEIGKKIEGVEGGGHCLHPNTLIQKEDGEICPISEIRKTDYVLGRANNQLINSECNKTFKIKKNKIICIKTPVSKIIASEDHRFFKYENFGIIEIKAKDLKIKDFILGVKEIPFIGKQIPLKSNSYIYLEEEGILQFKKKRLAKGFTRKQLHAQLLIKTQSVGNLKGLELLYSHRILENCLTDYLKVLGINKNNFMKKYLKRQFNYNSKFLNKEVAWLVGYIQGDGYIDKKRIECKEPSEQIINTFEKYISKNFNLNTTLVDMKTYKKIRVYSAELCRFFKTNLPESKLLSGSLRVPKNIMRAKKEIIAFYLRGVFDADGGVFDRFVHLDMIDRDFLKTIQLLLLRFGILSGLRKTSEHKVSWNAQKCYRLDVTDFESLKLFSKKVGFAKNSKKAKTLKKIIIKQAKKKRNSGILSPITYGLMREFVREYNIPRKLFNPQVIYKRTNIKRMNYITLKEKFIQPILKNEKFIKNVAMNKIKLFNKLCFDSNFKFYEVKQIKTKNYKKQTLIDLSVPKTENFMADGLIVHNSIAAGCKVPSEKLDEFLELLDKIIFSQISG